MFYLRRKLKYPLISKDPNALPPHTHNSRTLDEFELLLRPLAIGQPGMMDNQLPTSGKTKRSDQDPEGGTPRPSIYECLRIMEQEKVPVNVRHANIMLAAYVRAMRLKRAKKNDDLRFQGLREMGVLIKDFETGRNPLVGKVPLDVVSYNTAIKACCLASDAFAGLEYMNMRMKVPPNVVSFNTIIWSFARNGDQKQCEELLVFMGNHSSVKVRQLNEGLRAMLMSMLMLMFLTRIRAHTHITARRPHCIRHAKGVHRQRRLQRRNFNSPVDMEPGAGSLPRELHPRTAGAWFLKAANEA
ncbi:hypothetical protein TL16_g09688 [Triparma laevis f. inornata]|uniref:Pentatricopeptide repeat-containing protein n=1 Tax=Triparma laevis f. inornata TaxID=1714386 RepID=A0A9W7B459_9STRA|nr:hypothetical protein TL16_g09688 [Triparma laevis f. inornata]